MSSIHSPQSFSEDTQDPRWQRERLGQLTRQYEASLQKHAKNYATSFTEPGDLINEACKALLKKIGKQEFVYLGDARMIGFLKTCIYRAALIQYRKRSGVTKLAAVVDIAAQASRDEVDDHEKRKFARPSAATTGVEEGHWLDKKTASPLDQLIQKELVAQLTELQREALVGRFEYGETASETGERTGRSQAAIQSNFKNAIERLRKGLDPN